MGREPVGGCDRGSSAVMELWGVVNGGTVVVITAARNLIKPRPLGECVGVAGATTRVVVGGT